MTQRVSLAHVEGVVVWVLGAGPRERMRPQVHIERESGRLRAVMGQEEVPIMVRATLDDYVSDEGVVTRFPRRLTLRQGGRDVVFINTWLKRGEKASIAPGELVPPNAP